MALVCPKTAWIILLLAISALGQEITRGRFSLQKSQKHLIPYNVLIVLPDKESENDKFGLTIPKAKPVIDIAVEDVIKQGIMPYNWINLTYHDSRYWEDRSLAERWATTGVVQAYCERRLDAIFGFADSYSLATVAKVSAGFGHGVPVFTTAGLTAQIGSKKEFPFLTRMQGSYRQMSEGIYQLIAHQSNETASKKTNLNYKNLVFMYHDKRRAINRIQTPNGSQVDQETSSHCYFSLYAIKQLFIEKSDFFKEEWQINTPAIAIDEELPRTKQDTESWVKLLSTYANGKCTENSVTDIPKVTYSYIILCYYYY